MRSLRVRFGAKRLQGVCGVPVNQISNQSTLHKTGPKRCLQDMQPGGSSSTKRPKAVKELDVNWSVGTVLKELVDADNTHNTLRNDIKKNMMEWFNFFKGIWEENKKKKYKNIFEGGIDIDKLPYIQKHVDYYENRMDLVRFLSCTLFGLEANDENFEEFICLAILYRGTNFIGKLKERFRCFNTSKGIEFLEFDRLDLKFRMKGTFAAEKAVVSALKNILPKGSIQFAADSDVVTLKYLLKTPNINQLINPTGKGVGRWSCGKEINDMVMLEKSVVKHMNFFFGNATVPMVIPISHADGSTQTQVIPLFDSHLRYLNLGKMGRNPAALLPLALEEDKESRHLIDIVHTFSLKEFLESMHANGTTVICLGDGQCQMCEKGMQPVEFVHSEFGDIYVHNNIKTRMPYVWDLSA